MDFLGIGPLELFFILLIALIVLGPNDMVKAGKTLGRFLRRIVTSPTWQAVQQTSKDIRYLPNRLMREAGLEELKELKELKESLPTSQTIRKELGVDQLEVNKLEKELKTAPQEDFSAWTTPPTTIDTPPTLPEENAHIGNNQPFENRSDAEEPASPLEKSPQNSEDSP